MDVFITGASGWIGGAVVDDLLAAGHAVTGLARSDEAADRLRARGARVHRGDLDDLASLRAGAEAAGGVIHLANKHDWTDQASTNASERAAVGALGEVLAGSDRPLVVASGVAGTAQGRPATEDDATPFQGPDAPRGGSEHLALGFAERGVRAIGLRYAPTVHGVGDRGFIAIIADAARRRGVSGYPGDGTNRWAAVHRGDAAWLTRLALESAPAGSRVHAVAEEGVPTRDIAAALGAALGLPTTSVAPDDAAEHFGFISRFFSMDLSASSRRTRELLGWEPTGPGLLDDIAAGAYGRA